MMVATSAMCPVYTCFGISRRAGNPDLAVELPILARCWSGGASGFRSSGDPSTVGRNAATETPLHLSLDAEDDWLVALEFGAVIDGKPEEEMVVESQGSATTWTSRAAR
jgi:hypothetical protein